MKNRCEGEALRPGVGPEDGSGDHDFRVQRRPGALLLFGALLTSALFTSMGAGDYLFAAFTLALARPIAIVLAMAGARLSRQEKPIAGWFGPKGFASVFFGYLILHSGPAMPRPSSPGWLWWLRCLSSRIAQPTCW